MISTIGSRSSCASAMRPDAFRKPHPVYGRMSPATFDQVASTKLSVRINLKKPGGVALSKRLVAISDVAAESFRPGVVGRLGLLPPVLVAGRGRRQKVLVVHRLVARPHTAGRTEIRNAGFRRDARAGEDHRAARGPQHRRERAHVVLAG